MIDHPCKCNMAPPLSDDLRLLDSRSAAVVLGISPRSLSRFVTLGRIKPVRFSARCVRFRLSDLKALIEAAQKTR